MEKMEDNLGFEQLCIDQYVVDVFCFVNMTIGMTLSDHQVFCPIFDLKKNVGY